MPDFSRTIQLKNLSVSVVNTKRIEIFYYRKTSAVKIRKKDLNINSTFFFLQNYFIIFIIQLFHVFSSHKILIFYKFSKTHLYF